MTLLLLSSITLSGLAAGSLLSLLLQRQQQHYRRTQAKARLAAGKPQDDSVGLKWAPPFINARIRRHQALRTAKLCEAELPRMLDILAMGMQAGLSFDAALGLYLQRFDNELATRCRERFEVWERGLISRSEGLKQLAASVDVPLLDRFCRTASRSLKHGVPMAPLIKEYAHEARKEYRNKQKELVLKAPVKMLLPTGVLILPAMMMLIIGPIVLDVTGRMV